MAQSFTHELNPVKGWPSPYALDKSVYAALTNIQTDGENIAFAGMVGHIDATAATLKLGIPAITADANSNIIPMPLFLFQNGDDFDVLSPTGNSAYGWVGADAADAASATGGLTQKAIIGTLPASGSFELETTEYVATTYSPGHVLTSDIPGHADAGKLRKATVSGASRTAALQILCGVVSDGLINNEQYPGSTSYKRLRFWSIYHPVIA